VQAGCDLLTVSLAISMPCLVLSFSAADGATHGPGGLQSYFA
jgi:hypothetical protein